MYVYYIYIYTICILYKYTLYVYYIYIYIYYIHIYILYIYIHTISLYIYYIYIITLYSIIIVPLDFWVTNGYLWAAYQTTQPFEFRTLGNSHGPWPGRCPMGGYGDLRSSELVLRQSFPQICFREALAAVNTRCQISGCTYSIYHDLPWSIYLVSV